MSSPLVETPPADLTISSPRSTILSSTTTPSSDTEKSHCMHTSAAGMNETNGSVGAADAEAKDAPHTETQDDVAANTNTNNRSDSNPVKGAAPASTTTKPGNGDRDFTPTPVPQAGSNLPVYPSHLTPQPVPGYYQSYQHLHATPEPPSPSGQVAYDGGSFFQQHGAFATTHNNPFPNTPLSPPRGTATTTIAASPLFPRVTNSGQQGVQLVPGVNGLEQNRGAPPSPNLPYMSPPLGTSMYQQSYPLMHHVNSHSSNSPEEVTGWMGDRNQQQQNAYQQNSPQMNVYGMQASRAASGGRSYSFEETMLPPSAALDHDQGNPAYSPYGGSQGSPGGTLFAIPQSWGYGPPPDMYTTTGSPLQPRPTVHPQMAMSYPGMGGAGVAGGAGGMRPAAPYGQYYPASSPGPPIQTTTSNKGPDGANLFIFHIPNHFTNIDMYQLFCPYGVLLSVRIMVERDTGRSRGFGFVSYDTPEAAALAIKELNGFAIGNKRLKVQHKQIRQKDSLDHEDEVYGSPPGEGNYQRPPQFPAGAMGSAAGQNLWYDDSKPDSSNAEGVSEPDEGLERRSTSSGGQEASLGMGAIEAGPDPDSLSPLANLGTLQNALPEVPGNAQTE